MRSAAAVLVRAGRQERAEHGDEEPAEAEQHQFDRVVDLEDRGRQVESRGAAHLADDHPLQQHPDRHADDAAGGDAAHPRRRRHLVAAVRLVRSGDALLAPAITRRLVERFARRDSAPSTAHRDLATLTPRELEVLHLLAQGLSNAELAGRLHLSEATVKTHVARILAKLGLRDRVQAVVVAYRSGLVSPAAPE
ncbi:response regulator transcription factor [Actinoplanes sp. NPDC049118]|uniref:helix-turn-helix transcriptional regulator n=1 Tax=Actinoplanes sp. NPDC049118 TaxID=3155769 RepID=UPI0033EE9442